MTDINPHHNTTHGMTHTPEFETWHKTKQNHKGQVCKRWEERFMAFFEDMGTRPAGAMFRRKDSKLEYCKDNCCWEIPVRKREHHGKTNTVEYIIWGHITQRCYNPSCKQYADYGGRGIKMCQRWFDSFFAFLTDMGPRPNGLTIDRINNDGNYEPGNCRWATMKEQCSNRRSNVMLEYNGKTMTLRQWSVE